MARVYMDDGAEVMAKGLAYRMKWDEDTALGKLMRLYKESQALEAEHGDEVDLCLWMRVDPAQAPTLATALERARVVVKEGGQYRIRGNKAHIEKLRNIKGAAQENGKKGGRPKNPAPKPSQETGSGSDHETESGFEEEPNPAEESNQTENPVEKASTVPCSTVPCSSAQHCTAHITHARAAVAGQKACEAAWLDTLAWHGIRRDRLGESEDVTIGRAIRLLEGDAGEVELAIIGGRFDTGGPNYRPEDHCKLVRYLDRSRIVAFADLGRKAQDPAWVESWLANREARRNPAQPGLGRVQADEDELTADDLRAAGGGGHGA